MTEQPPTHSASSDRPQTKRTSTWSLRPRMVVAAVIAALAVGTAVGVTATRLAQPDVSLAPEIKTPQPASQEEADNRFYALCRLAKDSFNAGKIEDARKYARELIAMTPQYRGDWNYGNAVHDANMVLGRIAVREGNITDAKGYLTIAGKSPGSPQMDSFGPNVSLAKDLLERGERQVVLEYLELCRTFWTMHLGRLDEWRQQIDAGAIPDFGANLDY
ncbi:tetratricopeptide repeat protein [Nocardia sp. NPDC051321]|uniref:tetratricopeptide repeat protein n=1 Tax=Nocardia sp. NPDC051321 TaxID=3364323 RepID=UPI0037AB22CA